MRASLFRDWRSIRRNWSTLKFLVVIDYLIFFGQIVRSFLIFYPFWNERSTWSIYLGGENLEYRKIFYMQKSLNLAFNFKRLYLKAQKYISFGYTNTSSWVLLNVLNWKRWFNHSCVNGAADTESQIKTII